MLRRSVPQDISAREYAGFQRLVADASGITLGESKRQLLVGRLARHVRERGLPSFGAYLDVIHADRTGGEIVGLLDLIATNETCFFRERGHYDYLTQHWCPARRDARSGGKDAPIIRVWSAACSTGQEAYSIAMALADHCPSAEGWILELLASDLSTRALAIAEAGEYDIARSTEIPGEYLRRFMLRGVGASEGRMRVCSGIRAMVRFRRINLNDSLDDAAGLFDLVFCSNALIYFSRAGRAKAVARLARKLAPGGRLFVGHAESLHEHRDLLCAVAPTVYASATDTTN